MCAAFQCYDSASNKAVPLSFATGTKCVGICDNGLNGCIIRDSHAEVLARRALVHYLLRGIELILLDKREYLDDKFPLESTDSVGLEKKFRLKDRHQLWLFVSDSPCGAGSIYTRAHDRSFSGEKANSNLGNSTIGLGKPHSEDVLLESAPILETVCRYKPGRTDIEKMHRSLSMSCTDKIARWILLGVQG